VHLQEIFPNASAQAEKSMQTPMDPDRELQVCALDRAISKLQFELGIGSICSWYASESEDTRGYDITPSS